MDEILKPVTSPELQEKRAKEGVISAQESFGNGRMPEGFLKILSLLNQVTPLFPESTQIGSGHALLVKNGWRLDGEVDGGMVRYSVKRSSEGREYGAVVFDFPLEAPKGSYKTTVPFFKLRDGLEKSGGKKILDPKPGEQEGFKAFTDLLVQIMEPPRN